MEAARARGRLGGRKKALNAKERKKVVQMYERKNHTIKEICQMMKISKPTLYAYIRESQTTKKAKAYQITRLSTLDRNNRFFATVPD